MVARRLLLLVCLGLVAPSAACSGDDASPTDDAQADELRSALTRRDLPRGAFRTRAEEIAQEWLDGNIMTGDARLDAGVLRGRVTSAALAKFAEKMVTDHLRKQERTYRDIESKAPAFDDALLKDAATAVAVDGFVYDSSNPENVEPIEANVRELVTFLGGTSTLDVVKVTGLASDGEAEEKRVTQYLFLNRDTKQYVAFYAREGTI